MHAEAFDWLTKRAEGLGRLSLVVDVGGRNINGTVRHLFTADRYIAVDLYDGPGVDAVADIRDWQCDQPADLIVCAEVLEHAPRPYEVIDACRRLLKPGGRLLLTAAAPPRLPHSGHDGGPVRDGEHYQNIHPGDLHDWLQHWQTVQITYDAEHGDVYAEAIK